MKSITPLKTPVLFLVFNRPDTTKEVFNKIRQAKPLRLYVAGDGPRDNYNDDKDKIVQVREIATKVDWPCEVKTLFQDVNLGCKKAVSSAISWFFINEEKGIILEDDCVPHLDFFNFCERLLDRYADNEMISAITGDNFQNNRWRGDSSYYYSKYTMCWGWATWRRAWKNYDGDLSFWPNWSKTNSWLEKNPDIVERRYWKRIFDKMISDKIDTWDYPWMASVWFHGGLTVTPNVNLVSNIGFGKEATHTTSKNNKFSKLAVKELSTIKNPKNIIRDNEADTWTFNYHYGGKNLRFPYNWIIFPTRIINYLTLKTKKNF